jgi:putative holliday junction resolvase
MPVYLGFDVGTKTIGLAISDGLGMTASPLCTLARSKWSKEAELIAAVIAEYIVTDCVVGLPVNMDGTEGVRCQSTRAFARNLGKACGLPVHFWDERMSSAAVERTMLAADMSRAKRAEHVDKLAAAYILQGFLDAQRGGNSTGS